MNSHAARNPPIIGNKVSITIKPFGLSWDTFLRRKTRRTMKLAAGKISIPPKNKTTKLFATSWSVATIPATNQTIPDITAPGPPRRNACRTSRWATAISKMHVLCQVLFSRITATITEWPPKWFLKLTAADRPLRCMVLFVRFLVLSLAVLVLVLEVT